MKPLISHWSKQQRGEDGIMNGKANSEATYPIVGIFLYNFGITFVKKILKTVLTFSLLFLGLNMHAQKNIFEETFAKSKSKWALPPLTKKDSATIKIVSNELIFDNKQIESSLSIIEIPNKKININTDEEVTITASVKHISGTNIFGYGIVFGEKLPNNKFNGYCFTIVDTGYYRMYVAKNEKQLLYKDWTPAEVIIKNNGTNILTIVKKRNQFHFLINGQWLFYISNDNIKINSIGVINTQKQKVAFDDIKIESFAKVTDKKDVDKMNDLRTILQQSQNQFINAFALKNKENKKLTWLPYMNESSKNETILFGHYQTNSYEDNGYFEKVAAETRSKQYTQYIEKVLGQYEKIEKPNAIGKNTYWISKNPIYQMGTYIMLKEFSISDSYFIEFVVSNNTEMTKEKIETLKD